MTFGKRIQRVWLGLIILSVAGTALAHHSFAVYYLEADTIEVEGEIVDGYVRGGGAADLIRHADETVAEIGEQHRRGRCRRNVAETIGSHFVGSFGFACCVRMKRSTS